MPSACSMELEIPVVRASCEFFSQLLYASASSQRLVDLPAMQRAPLQTHGAWSGVGGPEPHLFGLPLCQLPWPSAATHLEGGKQGPALQLTSREGRSHLNPQMNTTPCFSFLNFDHRPFFLRLFPSFFFEAAPLARSRVQEPFIHEKHLSIFQNACKAHSQADNSSTKRTTSRLLIIMPAQQR
jgi:hypothetical protein